MSMDKLQNRGLVSNIINFLAGKYGRFFQKTGRGSLLTLTAYGLAFTGLLHLRTRC